MADRRGNPPLPLRRAKPRKATQPRMSRTTREPLHSILLPRNMGDNSNGCRLLERHEDTEEVVKRYC